MHFCDDSSSVSARVAFSMFELRLSPIQLFPIEAKGPKKEFVLSCSVSVCQELFSTLPLPLLKYDTDCDVQFELLTSSTLRFDVL